MGLCSVLNNWIKAWCSYCARLRFFRFFYLQGAYSLLLIGLCCAKPTHLEHAKASELLKGIAQWSPFQATFTYEQPEIKPICGRIVVQGKKYHLYTSTQEVICNGKTTWVYLPKEREVQISLAGLHGSSILPWSVIRHYKKKCRIQSAQATSIDHTPCYVVTLQAKHASCQILQWVLTFRQSKGLEQLFRITWQETDQQHSVRLENVHTEIHVDKDEFLFHPDRHPDVEVVDLR